MLKVMKQPSNNQNQKYKKTSYINKGFSLVETLIAVAIFSIFFTAILFAFSSLVKIEIKAKENVYEKFYTTNELSKKYYLNKEE